MPAEPSSDTSRDQQEGRPGRAAKKVQISCSPGFLDWLAEEDVSVAFTTYQTNRLFLVGRDEAGRLAAFERLLDRPMGLAATAERLWVATRFQLWRFDQVLAPGDAHRKHDRLFVPRSGHVTGEVDAHDVQLADDGREGDGVVFVNTLYSCLARLSERHSFEPLWRPPWISALAPEDRCHLNGLAVEDGRPRYVTAVARTDTRQGWREHRADGGVVVEVDSGEVVVAGLSMPHSPRLHEGDLYVFDSGNGEFGRVDRDAGRFEPLAFCPGYLRGLALRGRHALVGLSKPRDRTFRGLPLDRRLDEAGVSPRCVLQVIDLGSGRPLHELEIHGLVSELYDVAVVPGAVRPMALGFKSDELRRTITFEDEGGVARHVLRTLEAGTAETGGTPLPTRRTDAAPVRTPAGGLGRVAARTLELTREQALAHRQLTFPDLARTAASRPLPEPLLVTVLTAVPAASVTSPEASDTVVPEASGTTETVENSGVPETSDTSREEVVGLAVSVAGPLGKGVEVVSFAVREDLRRRGLGTLLLASVEAEMVRRGFEAVEVAYRDGWESAPAVRRLLAARGWSRPRPQVLLATTDFRFLRFLESSGLRERPLPDGYEIFSWDDLDGAQRREIVRRQQREPWYPEALSPFQLEERLDREVSVGLRHRGRVVGWLLAHRVGDEVVQYTSLFVEPGHGKLGRGLPLIAAAARRQERSGVPRAIFAVQADNRAMRRLLERRLAPYLAERSTLMRSGKRLGRV